MKLALLIYTSPDHRTGEPADHVLRPYDAVIGEFKSYVDCGRLPEEAVAKGYTTLEVWTQRGGRVKSHTFKSPVVNVEATEEAPDGPETLNDPAALSADGGESPTEIQSTMTAGLSPSEPGEETPQADEGESVESPDTTEVASVSPKGGGKKASSKGV